MSPWSGMLALTLVVRDEEDILAANLDYHLAQGVDVVLAIDHGSTDRTPEILREYEQTGQVRAFRDEDRQHDQVRRVNRCYVLPRMSTKPTGSSTATPTSSGCR